MSFPSVIKELVAEYEYPSFRVSGSSTDYRSVSVSNCTLATNGLPARDPIINLALKSGLWNVIRSPSRHILVHSPSVNDKVWAPAFSIILYHYSFDIRTLPAEIKCGQSTTDTEGLTLTICNKDKPVLHMEIGAKYPVTSYSVIYNHTIFSLQGVAGAKGELIALIIPIALTFSRSVENNYREIHNAIRDDLTQALSVETGLPLHLTNQWQDVPTLVIERPTPAILQQLGFDGKNDPSATALRDIQIDWKEAVGGVIENDGKIGPHQYDVSAPTALLSRLWDFIDKMAYGKPELKDYPHTMASIARIAGHLEPMYPGIDLPE